MMPVFIIEESIVHFHPLIKKYKNVIGELNALKNKPNNESVKCEATSLLFCCHA